MLKSTPVFLVYFRLLVFVVVGWVVFAPHKGEAKVQIFKFTNRRVPYSSHPGCQQSRRDVVPASKTNPARYEEYDDIINAAANVYRLPRELIWAIIKTESDFDPQVISCARAVGLMQLVPDVVQEQQITNPLDSFQNIMAGSRLLRLLANLFNGDISKTIAGYHAGAGAVQKYDGVPPYETTQAYVRMVLANYQKRKDFLKEHQNNLGQK